MYAAGFKGTPTTINDPGEAPASVTIDSKDNLGVTNILTTSDGSGSVSFFNKGGSLLTTLSDANFAQVFFDAFDDKGNLYIDGTNASGAFAAGEVVGGVSGKAITILATGSIVLPRDAQPWRRTSPDAERCLDTRGACAAEE